MLGDDTFLKRNIEIKVRLSKDELQRLDKCVKKTTLSREGYVRTLIRGYEPQSEPPEEYYDLVRKLREIDDELCRYADNIPLSNMESLALFGKLTKQMTHVCDRLQSLFLPRKKE